MRLAKYIIVVVFLFVLNHSMRGQDAAASTDNYVPEKKYQEILNEMNASATKRSLRKKRTEKKPKKKKKETKERKERKPSNWSFFQSLGIFEVISYFLIAGLVGFLLYFIFSNIEIDKKFEPKAKVDITEDLDDISELDTVTLLEQAIIDQDYRLAIRLRFLKILQQLSAKNKIIWRREKTNRNYVKEVRREKYGSSFQRLAYIFDHVWYGDQHITKEMYDNMDPEFSSFSKEINGY